MRLQNQRGGHLRLRDLSRPDGNRWESGLQAMESASHLDVSVNQSLLHLHRLASEVKDAHLCAFLSRHCLRGRLGLIKELGDHVTTLRKMGAPESGLAEDLSAKLTLGDSDKKN